MEDLELHESLQRYVHTGEPPFAFTAQSLITKARRRQRWRIGIGLGGGGAVTALAVASSMVLMPGLSSGGEDLFDGRGCRWVLPAGSRPPTQLGWLGSPTPNPATPTSQPGSPNPTSQPGSPNPTSQPGSPNPTSQPPTPYPSVPPDRLPDEVDHERQEEMSCFLKRRMLEMLPGVNHTAPSEAPMDVLHYPQLDLSNGWYATYNARTMIIHNGQLCFINVQVVKRGAQSRPPHGDRTTTPRGHEAYVSSYSGPGGEGLNVEVFTRDSRIEIGSDGNLLTLNQLFELADSRELDLFR